MLGQVVVEVTTIHQVEYETQFVRGVKGIRHAYNKRTVRLHDQQNNNINNHLSIKQTKFENNENE